MNRKPQLEILLDYFQIPQELRIFHSIIIKWYQTQQLRSSMSMKR